MKCPICGGAELIHDTRDVPYTSKGGQTVLSAIEGDYCPACGEIILDRVNCNRVSALITEFNKIVSLEVR
jgi:HTH-type transcriptional regulator/antitoxin MqsA